MWCIVVLHLIHVAVIETVTTHCRPSEDAKKNINLDMSDLLNLNFGKSTIWNRSPHRELSQHNLDIDIDRTMLPVIVAHFPAGAAVKQLVHYGQEVRSGHFRQYDYGAVRNYQKYNSMWPPDYDLSKITSKVVLLYSKNDWFAAVEDVKRLFKELPNCTAAHLVEEDTFNHVDFLWAIHVKELVYDVVLGIMARYL